jgi:uncharacterized protein (TIGR03083 family)
MRRAGVGGVCLNHRMDFERLRAYLDADFLRLRSAVAAADSGAAVPSCPGWTVDDLARHVAAVYLEKAESMRLGTASDNWQPAEPGSDPVKLLDETYASLVAQLDAPAVGGYRPADATPTWYEPDQTVGFWIRRMAQETVIHRIDAELAAGLPVEPIPDDLALDGIDEVLKVFLAYNTVRWPEDFAALLDPPEEGLVLVSSGQSDWAVQAARTGVSITDGVPSSTGPDVAVSISGEPAEVLRRLWGRALPGDEVTLEGEAPLIAQFQALLVTATQ